MTDQGRGSSGVFGIFDHQANLERAVNYLKAAGFHQSDISCLLPGMSDPRVEKVLANATKTPDGVAAGATTGFALGGILGWLAGVGALALPGIGPLIIAGPMMSAIACAGIGTALGGIAGALIGYGFPELEARRYEKEIRNGAYLLSIHIADLDWKRKAKSILQSCGARDISVTHDQKTTRQSA